MTEPLHVAASLIQILYFVRDVLRHFGKKRQADATEKK